MAGMFIKAFAQDTIRVNDTIVKVIINRSDAVPDSSVNAYEKYYEQSATTVKSKKEISKEVCRLLKMKSLKRYNDIKGDTLLYLIKTDRKGHVTDIKWFREFKHLLFFNKYIVDYLKGLQMIPAYKKINDKKININSSRVLQVVI